MASWLKSKSIEISDLFYQTIYSLGISRVKFRAAGRPYHHMNNIIQGTSERDQVNRVQRTETVSEERIIIFYSTQARGHLDSCIVSTGKIARTRTHGNGKDRL